MTEATQTSTAAATAVPRAPIVAPWSPAVVTAADDVLALDDIFFEASGTKSFASPEVRSAFRERWLGRYLAAADGVVYVARESAGAGARIIGYVVGTTADPAQDPRFVDIAYFRDLAPVTERYPAHLHINCAPACRGRGVGAALVEAFCVAARAKGAAGVHIVTGAGMRNIGFYERNGFRLVGHAQSNGKPVVMLGRDLAPP